MRKAIGEYGRVIIAVLVAIVLLVFLLSGGVANLLPEPKATIGVEDSMDIVDDIHARVKPTISVSKTTLKKKQVYDLTDKTMFGIVAKDADGQDLPVSVSGLTVNGRTVDPATGTSFKAEGGTTKVTYRTEDHYRGSVIATELEVTFSEE